MDINAATNTLKEGLRNISAGTVDYIVSDDVRLLSGKQMPVKAEAAWSLAKQQFTLNQ